MHKKREFSYVKNYLMVRNLFFQVFFIIEFMYEMTTIKNSITYLCPTQSSHTNLRTLLSKCDKVTCTLVSDLKFWEVLLAFVRN